MTQSLYFPHPKTYHFWRTSPYLINLLMCHIWYTLNFIAMASVGRCLLRVATYPICCPKYQWATGYSTILFLYLMSYLIYTFVVYTYSSLSLWLLLCQAEVSILLYSGILYLCLLYITCILYIVYSYCHSYLHSFIYTYSFP